MFIEHLSYERPENVCPAPFILISSFVFTLDDEDYLRRVGTILFKEF
jgi:hypothetical protein